MAQRVPAVGDVPARLAIRERTLAIGERHWALVVGAVWAAWLAAVLGVVIGGVASGAIADPHRNWVHFGGPLWPFFTWDFGWYRAVAIDGYPHGSGGPFYAFYPLWPLVLRASGSIPDWAAAFAVVVACSGLAFLGVAAASPSGRSRRAALALACWPGSFMLLLAYPDVVALAAAAWAAALVLRGRPYLAGALGAVGALARPTGFLIAIPLFLVARGAAARIVAAGAPIAAGAAVQIFFWERSGDPRAFIHAQELPIWARNGPSRISKWPGHLAHAFNVHALLLGVGAVVALAAVVIVARRYGRWYAAGVAYAFVVAALLLGAQTPQSRIQSTVLAVIVPLLGLLWWLGPRYRPWALFATAVVGVSFLSGTVTSFARQALFAFPVYWAVADGPRPLRHPVVAIAALAANVAFALTLAKYAP
ncbi:MAG TPA: glycosyltransferase 87 family protein [Gaiellaceae bacterium]|nr:glycosyltransferase 87 family protein [Gaiellaceae bacterium]